MNPVGDAEGPQRVSRTRGGIFCNRTLNLRSISAIGYDMDYTLVHYQVDEWERRAFEHIQQKLCDQGWPIGDLRFDPDAMMRGLIIDTELGNIVKANRFGYVKLATHGPVPLGFDAQRKLYSRTIIDLHDDRWLFLNTLFSLSEAWMYAQLVDLLDNGTLSRALDYRDLYDIIRTSLDETHMEGILKGEIITDPDRYVQVDPDLPLTLLDQRHAGKKLLLITNSEWPYSHAMMTYAFDRFLPGGMTWRDLFDVIVVAARKPSFFSSNDPFFEVVSDDGLLRPVVGGPKTDRVLLGGNAAALERYLGLSGDQILYVGDHVFSDVKVTKSLLRWRTALILPEIDDEVAMAADFAADQAQLRTLMANKERLELEQSQTRLMLQRKKAGYGPQPEATVADLEQRLGQHRKQIVALDERIAPLAAAAAEVGNPRWGPIMRAGNDKSHMARQVERHADIYTARVSNFLAYAPFYYFRSPRGSLPHDG